MIRLEGSFVWVRPTRGRASSSRRRASVHGATALARERFRMALLRRFYEEYGAGARGVGPAQLRGRREGAARPGLPRPRAQGGLAGRLAREARALAAHLAGRARCGRRRRSSTPASSGCFCRRGAGVLRRRRPAGRRGARARRIAAPHVRTRDRRRGAGPDADAAAHDRPPRTRRVADDPRRRRPGDRPDRLARAGRRAAAPARRRRGDRRGAASRLPRAARDHGGRVAAARHDRAGVAHRSPTAPAPSRPSSAASRRSTSWPRPSARPSAWPTRTGSSP